MALDIISTINLDLKRPNTETVYAVQYDTAGRIKAQLTNDGEAWHVPSSAGGMVSFRKSDNIGGFYDTTELGEVAVSVDENDDSIIYIALDAQTTITATPLDHPVQMQINFYNSQGKRLSTFAFYLRVQASVLFDGDQDERPVASEWTFRILTGALGQTIKNQEDAIKWMADNIRTQAGYVVDDTLKVPGAAGDAKKIGELFEEIVKISDSMPGYFPTTDTARVGSTKYYTRSGTAPNYVYTEYTGATFATGVTYYEYSPWNRIWIDPDDNDVAIPTMEELDDVKSVLTFEEEQRVNLDEIVNGEAKINTSPFVKRMFYGSSGYHTNNIDAYSQQKISAGKYRITPPTGFYVNIRYYVSDAEGGEVALVNTTSASTITLSDVAVLNIQSTDSHNITDEDIAFLDGSQIVKKQLSTSASLVAQTELLNETDKGIIHLSYLGTGYNSNIDVGLFGFTTSTNKLYYKDANGNVVYDDPYTDQIFLYGKNLYKWSGTNLDLYIILDQLTANSILNVLTNSIIALSYSAASNIVQNLNVGQIGLNTTTGELWYKYRSDASTSLAAKDNEYFYYQGKLYQWTNSALAEVLSIIEMNNAINMLLIPYKNGIVHLKYKTSQSGQSSTLSSGEFGYYEVDNKVYVRIGINSVKSFSPTTGVYEFDGLYYAWDGTKLAVKWNPEDYKTDVLKYTDLTPGYYNLSAISQLFFDPQQRFVAPSDGNPDGYGCTMIPVKKGWSIILTTNGGAGQARAWGWVDIEMMLGDVADASVSTTVTLTAPYDGYLVVNTVANNASKKERFSCIMQIPVKSIAQDLAFVSAMRKKNELLPQYDENNPCNALLQGVWLMASIHHWGIIGASFDTGEFNYYHGSDIYMCDYYKYAWPSVLQRLYGIPDLYIFGNGGQTSKGWVTSAGTTYVFATDQEEFVAGRTGYSGIGPGGGSWAYAKQHPKQAYVIVLGSNDINHESYDSGDLDRDIGTYDAENDVNIAPDNPTASVYGSTGLVDSYAGYMSGIIQRIQSIQPNAKIFVATIRAGFAYNSTQYAKWNRFNSVVNALPDYFNNVYVIDYGKYGPRYWETDFKAKYWTIDHPNATGYQIMAYYYGTLINKAIQDHADEFNGTQWIGYNRPIMT